MARMLYIGYIYLFALPKCFGEYIPFEYAIVYRRMYIRFISLLMIWRVYMIQWHGSHMWFGIKRRYVWPCHFFAKKYRKSWMLSMEANITQLTKRYRDMLWWQITIFYLFFFTCQLSVLQTSPTFRTIPKICPHCLHQS